MKLEKINALMVNQWLVPEWDEVQFQPVPPRGKPEPCFFQFSISAYHLKRLSGIYRRDASQPPAADIGIQRRHEPGRSKEILRYIQNGFPLSRIDPNKLVEPSEINDLRMPGWIPTAIIVNILKEDDTRGEKGLKVAPDELVKIGNLEGGGSTVEIELPSKVHEADWHPVIHPIEIIDGQHRLWAFEEPEKEPWTPEFKDRVSEFQVPVVAYYGLDRTWQAYLFYTINQLPKRIDQSLVFDLYPLLRTEEWLQRFEGPNVYRDSRAQDLVIALWSHPESPWKDRIMRLGGRKPGMVTQASFIRSLTASFIKRWQEKEGKIGGFFGAPERSHHPALNWSREQQAAFLIMVWKQLEDAINTADSAWTNALRDRTPRVALTNVQKGGDRQASLFVSADTLLSTDQGVRGYLSVLNDLLAIAYKKGSLHLHAWEWTRDETHVDDNAAISDALHKLEERLPEFLQFVHQVAASLSSFDWRLSSAVPQSDAQYFIQAAYRGSGGYSLLRRNLINHLIESSSPPVKEYAVEVAQTFGYELDEEV